jgi:hypothetical protein
MIDANIRRSLIASVSLTSLISCAPLQDKLTSTSNELTHTTSIAPTGKDDSYYQDAVRAITGGDYARALDYLQAARQVEANDVRVLNAFGVVYDKLGRFDLSARYYAQALAVNPLSPIVSKNIAYSAVLQKMAGDLVKRPEMAASARPPATVQATSSLPPSSSGHDVGGAAQVAQTQVAHATMPAPSASQLSAPIRAASSTHSPSVVLDMADPRQPTQTQMAHAAMPAAILTSQSPTPIQAASSIPSPSSGQGVGGAAQVAQTQMAHAAMPAPSALQSPAPIQATSSVPLSSSGHGVGGPAQVAQTLIARAAMPAIPASQSSAPNQATSSVPLSNSSHGVGGPVQVAETQMAHAAMPAPSASQSPSPIQATSSVPPSSSSHGIGGPAQVAETQMAHAAMPAARSASQSPAPIQAASSIPSPSSGHGVGGPAQVAQIQMAHAAMPAISASQSPAPIQAASSIPASNLGHHVEGPAQVAQTQMAHAAVPAILTSQSLTPIQAMSSVPRSSSGHDGGGPTQVARTQMAHAGAPAVMASQSQAPIQSALRSQPVSLLRRVAQPGRSIQAGMMRVSAQIPPTKVTHPQQARGLTGHPLAIVNATGRGEMTEPVRRRLVQLGWSAPHWAETSRPSQRYTTIRYAASNAAVAHALARTLPFPVHLATCADRCKGIVLTMGTTFLAWKPGFAKLRWWTV